MTYIQELQEIIKRLHGVDASHVETVPIKETFQGQTVWEGEVEVFDLQGHPDTHPFCTSRLSCRHNWP